MRRCGWTISKAQKVYLITCVGVISVVLFLQESQTRGYSRLHDNFLVPFHDLRPTEFPLAAQRNGSRDMKFDNEDELTQILEDRLSEFPSDFENLSSVSCSDARKADQECFDSTCTAMFASSPRERLRQVLSTRFQIPSQYQQAMASSTESIAPQKYIFVTAVSSNHYYEMQGLVHSVHQFLFPRLSNYTFVIFDLGLTPFERHVTEKNCRCTVLDFPFPELPQFMRHLTCYAWKPVVIASLLHKAEYLLWMDACIRWEDSASLENVFQRSRQRGVQCIKDTGSIAVRTVQSTFEFHGDQPCQYSPFAELLSGFELFYNDRFTREALVEPWLSCAFDQRCMCVKDFFSNFHCDSSPPRRYGRCHRFDQSGMGIILSKLLLDQRPIVYLPRGSVRVARGELMNWFEPRKESAVVFVAAMCFVVNVAVCVLWILLARFLGWTSSLVPVRSCDVGVLVGEVVVVGFFLWVFV